MSVDKDVSVWNYGIDALRVVSMLMVLVLHILGQGGLLAATEVGTWRYALLWGLEIMAYCAVDCYALISGYVGVKSHYRVTNIVLLWLRVAFYTLLITGLFALFAPTKLDVDSWKFAMFPVMFRQYWYVTAYVVLFMFMPFLNVAINNLDKKQLKLSVLLLGVLFTVLPMLFRSDPFYLHNGYSALWLIILYIIGGYFAKYGTRLFSKCKNKIILLGHGVITLLTLGMKVGLELAGKGRSAQFLISYTSPVVLIMALSLLVCFSRLHVRVHAKKIIAFFAPLAFSVYIIHVNPLVWKNIVAGSFIWMLGLPWPMIPVLVLIVAFVVFVVLSLVDMLREQLFKKLQLKQRLCDLENKLLGSK